MNTELIKRIENQDFIEEKSYKDFDKLLEQDEYGFSLLHYQLLNGWDFLKCPHELLYDNSILKIKTLNGLSIFEVLVWRGFRTTLSSIHSNADFFDLFYTEEYASFLQDKIYREVKESILRGYVYKYDIVLLLYNTYKEGPIIIYQVKRKIFTENKQILKWWYKDKTIAHIQVEYGWKTEDKEILCIVDTYGDTVAHYQARRGWTTTNEEILFLENKYKKIRVIDLILEKDINFVKNLSSTVKTKILL